MLYFFQYSTIHEGLAKYDTNDVAVDDVINKFETNSTRVRILPISSTKNPSSSKTGIYGNYPNIFKMPLSQYFIKSSYNSACSDIKTRIITAEMLKYTLSRGCRFIDFEISNINGAPYVVYSNYETTNPIVVENCCKLDSILKTVLIYGLQNEKKSSSTGPTANYSDPLFIHLRINNDKKYKNIYQDVAKCIVANLGSYLYGNVNNKDNRPPPMSTTSFVDNVMIPILSDSDIIQKFQVLNMSFTSLVRDYLSKNANSVDLFNDLKTFIYNTKNLSSMDVYDFIDSPKITAILSIPLVNTYLGSMVDMFDEIESSHPLYEKIMEAKILINHIRNSNAKFDIYNTKMEDLLGKVIIIMDSQYNPNWKSDSSCVSKPAPCLDLSKYVHFESGNTNLTLNSESSINSQVKTPITINKDGLTSSFNQNGLFDNTNYTQIILPESDLGLPPPNDETYSNPYFRDLVTNWSCNFITHRFYLQDDALDSYERFFDAQELAIVPLSMVKNYIVQQNFQ